MVDERALHIIAPSTGGVADYAWRLALDLAEQGALVHLWAPEEHGLDPSASKVTLHPTLGKFGIGDLRRTDREMEAVQGPRRLLVQWVPHGFGWRSANLAFCLWVLKRSRVNRDRVELMVHEPFLEFGEGSRRQDVVAVLHRGLITLLLSAADRVWVSIPAWVPMLRSWAIDRSLEMTWLPIPSNVEVHADGGAVERIRARYAVDGGTLVGHFGTFGSLTAELLEGTVPELLDAEASCSVLLIGNNSVVFGDKLVASRPDLAERIHASGRLPEAELSHHLSACDIMVQPYPDGISSRRTSAMAALIHGIPVVANVGRLSESFWKDSEAIEAVSTASSADMTRAIQKLAHDPERRRQFGIRAKELYQEKFSIERIVDALTGSPAVQRSNGPKPQDDTE